ncbi:hypothetical protein J0H58_32570 [bacterium]|nr:hypothetical protein [bacterium]
MLRATVAVAVLTVCGSASSADPITFKEYVYQTGDRVRVTNITDSDCTTTKDQAGKKDERVERTTRTIVYTQDVIAAADGRVSKYRRVYEQNFEVKGEAVSRSPLEGMTVLIEFGGGRFGFTRPDGTVVPGPGFEELDREFNTKREDAPGGGLPGCPSPRPPGPVTPGQSWNLAEKLWPYVLPADEFGYDRGRAKASGKLLAVHRKGGAVYADVLVRAEAPLTVLHGVPPLSLRGDSSIGVVMHDVSCVDGSSPDYAGATTMRMILDYEAELPNGAFRWRSRTDTVTSLRVERLPPATGAR